jgi:uncharacterized tellurite resistance protein B-like protein
MNRKWVIAQLYYLLIRADGKVSEKELKWGEEMAQAEGYDREEFEQMLDAVSHMPRADAYERAVESLRALPKEDQLRITAWLCVIANSDGFMDTAEWKFVYRLYQKELGLELKDIVQEQVRIISSVSSKTLSNFTHQSLSPLTTTGLRH